MYVKEREKAFLRERIISNLKSLRIPADTRKMCKMKGPIIAYYILSIYAYELFDEVEGEKIRLRDVAMRSFWTVDQYRNVMHKDVFKGFLECLQELQEFREEEAQKVYYVILAYEDTMQYMSEEQKNVLKEYGVWEKIIPVSLATIRMREKMRMLVDQILVRYQLEGL